MDIQKELNGTRNIFLTGPAGTGKSYILNQYIDSHKNVLVCAPTGIAALNIGGETLHKVFHIPIPAFDGPSFAKGKKGAITTGVIKTIAQADSIIIDEISMCRNDVFRFVVKVIRKAEKMKGSKIKLIVSGDFSQLPPVIKKDDLPLFKKFDLDPSGYAFTTQEWKSCNFKVIELSEPKRQEDAEFIHILNKIRLGEFMDFDYFNQFVNEDPDYTDSICICGTNAEADRINQEYLSSLPGMPVSLQSKKEGKANFISGFNNDIITIKEGAKIIFTSNDVMHDKYKNGTFGVIHKFIDEDCIQVDINGEIVEIYKHEYPIYDYSVSGVNLVKNEVGRIVQFPFKVGKAITIHKSQGQTFDKAIISPEIFAAGQLYVVLSRVRSPEGITLLRPIEPENLIIDPVVQRFYNKDYTWDVKPSKPKTKTSATTKTAKSSSTKKSTGTKKTTKSTSRSKSSSSATKRKTVTKRRKTTKK